MFKIQKVVRAEKPRTLSCNNCSFTFNPLSISPYRNLKIDLRKYMFYQFISDDGKIDYPVKSIMTMIDISYKTAVKIKTYLKTFEKPFSKEEIDRFFKNKTEDHPFINIILQSAKIENLIK
jgi:hypothetical protein